MGPELRISLLSSFLSSVYSLGSNNGCNEASHLTPPALMSRTYTSTTPYIFMACCLSKLGGNKLSLACYFYVLFDMSGIFYTLVSGSL